MIQKYDGKAQTYFGSSRQEIDPLLAPHANCALEVGCGKGMTMGRLKATQRVGQAFGIELFENAAMEARAHFEDVIVGDAESVVHDAFPDKQFDLILCLDVLEHMIDPWRFVIQLEERLTRGGRLVISVPNIRCLRISLPLLIKGQWKYTDDGILDRTHLRFFVKETALQLAAGSRLRVDRCIEFRPPGSRLITLNRWSFGALRNLTAVQYLIASSFPDA